MEDRDLEMGNEPESIEPADELGELDLTFGDATDEPQFGPGGFGDAREDDDNDQTD